jgi:hypothetical protein
MSVVNRNTKFHKKLWTLTPRKPCMLYWYIPVFSVRVAVSISVTTDIVKIVFGNSKQHKKFHKILICTVPLPHERVLPFGGVTLPSSVWIASLNTHQNSTEKRYKFSRLLASLSASLSASLISGSNTTWCVVLLNTFPYTYLSVSHLHEELPI